MVNKIILSVLFPTVFLFAQETHFQPDSLLIMQQTNIAKIKKISASIDSLKEEIVLKAEKIITEENISQIKKNISSIKTKIDEVNKKVNDLSKNLEGKVSKKIDELNKEINASTLRIVKLETDYSTIDSNLSATKYSLAVSKRETEAEIINIEDKISKRTLYWLIAIISILLLLIVIFLFLKFKMVKHHVSLSEEIISTRKKLELDTIKMDSKLIEVMEQNLNSNQLDPDKSIEPDHSLPLKVGEEIHRMRNRLSTIESSHEIKVVMKRLESLEEKLITMGYEIVKLESRDYHECMNINAHFAPDENLNEGESVISRVIKPQINYKNKLIQVAEVEVRQGI